MKRRIDNFFAESMRDCMNSPHHYLTEYDNGDIEYREPLPVLRNEWLWRNLKEAQRALAEAEAAVLAACTHEPLDDVERECGLAMLRTMADPNASSAEHCRVFDECRARLAKHAETA